jgi:peptide/nickel transport system substrate-binding protein
LVTGRAAGGALGLLLVLLSACGPADPGIQTIPTNRGASSSGGSPVASSEPKTLTIALANEPQSLEGFQGSNASRGSGLILAVVHSSLAMQDEHGVWQPQLVAERVSVENGTWKLNPDGSMDVIWKLRPNTRWHDERPFTSTDLLFTFKVKKDPAYPSVDAAALALMDSASAPDPLTFVVHYTQPYYRADAGQGLDPLPAHILGPLYDRGDSEAFVNAPYFNTQFVGLGPYRLQLWQIGEEMDFGRWAGYFLGRPAVDTVIVRFILDPNTMVAAILAGAVDVVYPPGVDFDTAVNVQERWRGTGNVVRFDPADPEGRLRVLEIQYRPEYARPAGALANPTVRQALYTAIDRQTFVEVITHGLATVADSWVPPSAARRSALESAIPQYPYDPTRAQQMLAQAGWRPSGDGVLTQEQSGERFDLTLRASQFGGAQVGKAQELAVIADNWKQVGVNPTFDLRVNGTAGDRGYEAASPGVWDIGNMAPQSNLFQRLNSKYIATEANRYTGFDLTGYTDATADRLLDSYYVAIDPNAQLDIERQLLQKVMGEVVVMPIYWEVLPVLIADGVDSSLVSPLRLNQMYQWSKR